jgi:hypothetical protein
MSGHSRLADTTKGKDDLDPRGVHSKAVRANNETEEVCRVHAESALLDFGV